MRKALFIIGLAALIAAILFLLLAGMSRFAHDHTLDASGEYYAAMRKRARAFLAVGLALAAAGAACMIVRYTAKF